VTDLHELPASIPDEAALDELLSRPSDDMVALMERLEGDIIVLGVAGKMGVSLASMAKRAIEAAGVDKRVIGVARFSDPDARAALDRQGVETIKADLLDREAVAALPAVRNVIYMVGRKFGTQGREDLTWATNVVAPDNAAQHFKESRIVVFSTGCVYPLVTAASGGCTEATPPNPVGEYAQSCLGRERVFGYWSREHGTPVCLFRLNYAIDLRYGVLYDIAGRVLAGEPVNLSAGHFNVIWQGDANARALLALEHAASPPLPLNVTGPETVPVRYAAETFARLFETEVTFTGEDTGSRMYLSNAARSMALFGYPTVPLLTMIRHQADWLRSGGRSLGKPTHFEVVDGEF
jgi:nucleoside-diphosphate-sugar epimerase